MHGARHDIIIAGPVTAYLNTWIYKQNLHKKLATPNANSILQENIWIILSLVKMHVLDQYLSILHFSINLPMRWLARKTSKLVDEYGSIKKMGMTTDLVHNAFVEMEKDSKKILDEKFMMNISKPL